MTGKTSSRLPHFPSAAFSTCCAHAHAHAHAHGDAHNSYLLFLFLLPLENSAQQRQLGPVSFSHSEIPTLRRRIAIYGYGCAFGCSEGLQVSCRLSFHSPYQVNLMDASWRGHAYVRGEIVLPMWLRTPRRSLHAACCFLFVVADFPIWFFIMQTQWQLSRGPGKLARETVAGCTLHGGQQSD